MEKEFLQLNDVQPYKTALKLPKEINQLVKITI